MKSLPKSIQEIADVIGRDQAMHLIGQLPRSGKRSWRICLYVPQHPGVDHLLTRIIGQEDAERLAEVFGGEILHLANYGYQIRAIRNESIRRQRAEGCTVSLLAWIFDMSERNIRKICRGK